MAYGDASAPVTALPSLLLRNKISLTISKCGVKYFEQPAMDLCLQLIKAQNSWILWLMDVSGCLTLLLLKCPCSQTCQLCSAKWCYVSYFQRLEICMQIRSVNFRKFTRTWFATRVFIFRPPETLLCVRFFIVTTMIVQNTTFTTAFVQNVRGGTCTFLLREAENKICYNQSNY